MENASSADQPPFVALPSNAPEPAAVEAVLGESEQRYRSLFEQSIDAVLQTAPDGQILAANAAACQLFGRSEAELRQVGRAGVVDFSDPRAAAALEVRARTGRFRGELTLIRGDGTRFPVEVSTAVYKEKNGRERTSMIIRDISEQRRLERELLVREQRLNSFFQSATVGLLLLDKNLRFVQINDLIAEMNGIPVKEHLGRTIREVLPKLAPTLEPILKQVLTTGRPVLDHEFAGETPGQPGVQRHWVQSVFPVPGPDGRPEGVGAVGVEITQRKRAEEALRAKEDRMRLLDDNLPDSFVYQHVRSPDGSPRFLYVSAGVERLLGFKPEVILRDNLIRRGVAPGQMPALRAAEKASLRDLRDLDIELKICRADGEWRWFHLRSRSRRNAEAQVVWDGVATDITERKRAAEALRESEERFSSAFRNAAIGMALVGLDGKWLQVNRALCQQLGYSEDELLAGAFQDITHPEDLGKDLASMRQTLSGEIDTYQMQKRYYHKSGRIVWGLLSVSLVRNSHGRAAYFISQIQDITAHRQAEAELIESEAKFRVLANGTASAIFIYRGNHIAIVNSAFQSITGYREAELLGMNFWEIAHPEFRGMVRLRGMARQQGKHPPTRYEFRIVTKSGQERWLDLTDGIIDFQGSLAALGTAVDITERKQAELEVQRSRSQLRALLARFEQLREEERTRIAREVHDVLGQMLTGLKMDISWCERRLSKITDEPLRRAMEEKVQSTSRVADVMIETVQAISRELRPSLLDNIGLGAALEFEGRQFQERTGIACKVSVPSETVSLQEDIATGIFRVSQELLTNVARHASATQVAVTLHQSGEQVVLEVSDNGRGIREEELHDPRSLGLLGMSERASLMGGTLQIARGPSAGTRAVLTILANSG